MDMRFGTWNVRSLYMAGVNSSKQNGKVYLRSYGSIKDQMG